MLQYHRAVLFEGYVKSLMGGGRGTKVSRTAARLIYVLFPVRGSQSMLYDHVLFGRLKNGNEVGEAVGEYLIALFTAKCCRDVCRICPILAKFFPNFAKFCQILRNVSKFCQILPNAVKCCQIWPIVTKYSYILQNIVKFYQILPNFSKCS